MEVHDTYKYGRSVANILVDGKSLNEELVKAGYAWVIHTSPVLNDATPRQILNGLYQPVLSKN
jgi:endonuclease YncB( thermonuclease family)